MPTVKKIVFISHTSNFSGGAEFSMLDLCDEWRHKYGVETSFVIKRPTRELSTELKKRKYNYTALYFTHWLLTAKNLNAYKEKWNAKQNIKAIKHIGKHINKLKPDLVISNTSVVPWGAIAAKDQSIPHVWFVREHLDSSDFLGSLIPIKDIFEDIDRLSSLVVANSEFMALEIKKIIKDTPIKILYPSFSHTTLPSGSSSHTQVPFTKKSKIKLVIAGTIKKSKGQIDIVRAVGELKRRGVFAELCILGEVIEKDYEEIIKAHIDKYKISDRIFMVGYSNDRDTFIEAAQVGIMTSTREAFGRVTVEYMMNNKPVIGVNSGGTLELIDDNISGFFYTAGNHIELADKIEKYCKDADLLKKHSLAASKKAKKVRSVYKPERLFESLLDIEPQTLNSSRTNIENYLYEKIKSKPNASPLERIKYKLAEVYLRFS